MIVSVISACLSGVYIAGRWEQEIDGQRDTYSSYCTVPARSQLPAGPPDCRTGTNKAYFFIYDESLIAGYIFKKLLDIVKCCIFFSSAG